MCGIAGIWNYKTRRPVERERLQAITRLLSHRGPDGEGYYLAAGIGLGHRRLSIIDLEGGRQPMCNEDGNVWIVFNGEIYNYPDLRRELLAQGHTFRTNSDTEAIVHLYEEYGENCFERLRGMFALAIWDERQHALLLARDRLGIKPLFYGLGREGIVFASEMKSICASGLVNLEVESTAIADLFTFFYIAGPKTIYRAIHSLDPGSYLRINPEGLVKRKYWDLQEGQLWLSSEKQYEEQLLAILHESVRCHLLSDVPVGAFLSGGVDSSSVVGLMSGFMEQPVMTCSIGFDEQEFNELPQARAVAQSFHTSHQEQVVRAEPAKILHKLAGFYDQPFPDHSCIPTYYVSQLARQRVKVVLSGDGGDENFAGYSRYRRQVALNRIRRFMPHALLQPFKRFTGNRETGALPHRLARVLHQAAIGARDGYLHGITIADARLRNRIFSSDLKRELVGYDPHDRYRAIYDQAPGLDPLSKIFYLDLKTYLVDDILTKVDRASMANSLEVRVPILDHRVVEFAYSLPLHLKLRDGQGKFLLRNTVRHLLPKELLTRKKMGFRIPLVPWMQGELRSWAEEILMGDSAAAPFLDRAGTAQVWEWFQQGRIHLGDVLGVMLSFSLSSGTWAPGVQSQAASEKLPLLQM